MGFPELPTDKPVFDVNSGQIFAVKVAGFRGAD